MASERKPLFKASNHHVADSGEPPFFDADTTGKYFGYFQNEYGEQLVFVYDYAAKSGVLYHGDAGWDHPVPVVDGNAPRMVLNEPEALWLSACWQAVASASRLGGSDDS